MASNTISNGKRQKDLVGLERWRTCKDVISFIGIQFLRHNARSVIRVFFVALVDVDPSSPDRRLARVSVALLERDLCVDGLLRDIC